MESPDPLDPIDPIDPLDPLDSKSTWYKDAIIYELHVRAFHDSDGDGIGDFRGLTQKLDYLQDLGVTALWLLPFYPSPLRDDGYDIADYRTIHPSYGTLSDFQRFLDAAHRRDLRVITELVINHTSDQHPWFQRARRAPPGSVERDFYMWSESAERYKDARIIFQDFETSNWAWDPVARSHFWHRFYSHQPDLNYDNLAVHEAVFDVLDYWMQMGVDGLRLDAVPYLYAREGTNCENLPETHDFLKKLRAHIQARFPDRMLLAEANQWPEDAAAYFGDDDECHMNFHFPLMPRLYLALQQESRFPIIDILEQTPQLPPSGQWALFLRNHDELTLEMVSDEERDSMYRTFARHARARINLGIRRRLAPLLDGDRRRIELMNGLLCSLPGTPVLYYGDEIGMGDNVFLGDRNGVRTPMQWSPDRNAGFSRANPQQLYLPVVIDPEYHFEAVNVEVQHQNPSSLLWWTRRLIALRKHYKSFGRGSLRFLYPDNRKVLVFLRQAEDGNGGESVLCVFNLSRAVQYCQLDLSELRGRVPRELFGHTAFPPITESPYFLTLAPYAFHWFALESQHATERPWVHGSTHHPLQRTASDAPATLQLHRLEGWRELFDEPYVPRLERLLVSFLPTQRWFRSKATPVRAVRVHDTVLLPDTGPRETVLVLVDVEFVEGEEERYVLPLAVAFDADADSVRRSDLPVLARVTVGANRREGVLYDAMADASVASALLDAVRDGARLGGALGAVRGVPLDGLPAILAEASGAPLAPRAVRAEQSNTSIVFGDRLVLKLYRRVERGESLDVTLGRMLTEAGFAHAPALAGVLEYSSSDPDEVARGKAELATLASLQAFVHNEGDAWRYSVDELHRLFEDLLANELPPPTPRGLGTPERWRAQAAASASVEPVPAPTPLHARVGVYLDQLELLGRRTAQMHRTLASSPDPRFAPEPFTQLYQRSVYQSMRTLTVRTFELLERAVAALPERNQGQARRVLAHRDDALAVFRRLVGEKLDAVRIATHGDYHLGQVLFTGNDFVITDFEGEPARPLSERRIKRSPLRDVAGMLRSFHYAAHSVLFDLEARELLTERARPRLEVWADAWYDEACRAFMAGYLNEASSGGMLPDDVSLLMLLRVYLLEKAIYELGYELNNRPDWLPIPLRGVEALLGARD